MKYTKEQIAIALQMLGATGFPRKVIEILGYPSNPMLYHWRKKYPELYNSPQVKHRKQASSEFKLEIIHMLLHNEGIIVSEKVIRRIMKQEQLIVKQKRTKKYNSYKGVITPAVENIVNRDFHAEKPNQK